jgi:hypothetical protein
MLTDTLENRLLDASLGRFGWSGKPSNLYLALLTQGPNTDAGGNAIEVSRTGTAYARVAVPVASNSWLPDATTGDLTNAGMLTWPLVSGDWGDVSHVGIYSQATGGTLFGAVALPQTETILKFNSFSIPPERLTLRMRGATSILHRLELWNWLARGIAIPSVPRLFFALGTGVLDANLVGEPDTVHGYERCMIANSQSNFPAAAAGTKSLAQTYTSIAASSSPSIDWPQASHLAIFDAAGPRNVNSIASNTCSCQFEHYFANTNRIVFLNGANDATAALGVTPQSIYFVRDKTATGFKIATTAGGAAVTLTSTLANTFTVNNSLRAFLVSDTAINSAAAITGDAYIPCDAPHGLVIGDRVHFAASSAPTNFTTNRVLWVVDVLNDTVALSETEGGTAIVPGSAGSGIVLRKLMRGRMLYAAQLATPLQILAGESVIYPGGSGGLDFTLD